MTAPVTETLKARYSGAFSKAEADLSVFEAGRDRLPLNMRAISGIFTKIFKELQYLKQLPTPDAEALYAFFKELFVDILVGLSGDKRFDLEKALVIFAVVSPETRPSEVKFLHDLLVHLKGTIQYPVTEFENTFTLLLDLLRKRRAVPQIQVILEEIRDHTVTYAARNCLHLGPEQQEPAVALLSSLLMKRIYNAMYWYLYFTPPNPNAA